MGLFDWFFKPNVEKLERKKDIKGLIDALRYEKDSDVRQEAAEALGRIEDLRAIGPLIIACGDPYLTGSRSYELAAERALEKFKRDPRVREALSRFNEARDARRRGWSRDGEGNYYVIG